MKRLSELVNLIPQTPESRLLPENPANGDIPCFDATATTGGGNDANTAALLHLAEVPPADTAAGNSAPLLITTTGTAAQNTETPKFGSSCVKLTSGCIKIPVDDAKFTAKNWAASLWFRPVNTNTTFVMGHDADNNGGGWNVQWGSEGFKLFNRAGTSSPWKSAAANAWHWLAVVKNSGQLLFYVNGAKIGELANVEASCVMTIGAKSDDANYYPITGDVQEFRLQYLGDDELPGWTGSTIPVQAAPYSKVEVIGEWGKFNKSQLVTTDSTRLLPEGAQDGNLLGYSERVDRGNGADVKFLLQDALTDSAKGNASPAVATVQGVTLDADNNLSFDGNDSHITAVLATDEIFAADKEWTIDFWMKPTANSSEWNYILTQTTGSWGSRSLGLTWNKTKNVLEQDSGGYVARIIQASTWPDASTPCAADTWHFVVVEKQKTATCWNLNYYLNGAIWLQVAFNGDFVPFTSDNPFWFGGKTTDGGRWFKGLANKIRVTAGARYGGKAFTVPDRSAPYQEPAGQPVWVAGITEAKGEFGYFKLPNGTIVQYGRVTTISGANFSAMFPIAFPHALSSITATVKDAPDKASVTASPVAVSVAAGPNETTDLYGSVHCIGDQFNVEVEVYWVAIGY